MRFFLLTRAGKYHHQKYQECLAKTNSVSLFVLLLYFAIRSMRSYRDMVQCPGFYLCSNIYFLNPHKRLNPRQQDASQHYMLSWNIKHWSMPTIYLFIYLSIPFLSNSFIHSFIYLFIHSFNYLISIHIIYIGNYIHYIYIILRHGYGGGPGLALNCAPSTPN